MKVTRSRRRKRRMKTPPSTLPSRCRPYALSSSTRKGKTGWTKCEGFSSAIRPTVAL